MKKVSPIIVVFVVACGLLSCNKEEKISNDPQEGICFYTDQSTYTKADKIVVKFWNNTESNILSGSCRLYHKEIFKNNSWKITGEGPCPGGSNIYIVPKEWSIDTIKSQWLEEGKYRLVAEIYDYKESMTVYSNEFVIME
jgi:hypothetical protein